MLADPHEAVQAQDEVDAARQRREVRLEPADERRRHDDELAVAELRAGQIGVGERGEALSASGEGEGSLRILRPKRRSHSGPERYVIVAISVSVKKCG